MALQTICDNCQTEWLVDSIILVDAVDENLCPNCVNQLVDLCWARFPNAIIGQIKQDLEDY